MISDQAKVRNSGSGAFNQFQVTDEAKGSASVGIPHERHGGETFISFLTPVLSRSITNPSYDFLTKTNDLQPFLMAHPETYREFLECYG